MHKILGTRGSDLALAQAHYVAALLKSHRIDVELKIIRTQGDKEQVLSFNKMEGKGFFTKELEDALLAEQIDLAVHSFKDLPTESPKGLCIAAMPERVDARDCLVVLPEYYDAHAVGLPLKQGVKVGSSAVRRKAQLKALRSDLETLDLRGNVPTRIEKLRQKNYGAIVLAKAGLLRLSLDLSAFKIVDLAPEIFVPAPAQGALAIQIRSDDQEFLQQLQVIHQTEIYRCVAIERELLNRFEGGCHLPLGVHVFHNGEQFMLQAFFGYDDGSFKRFSLQHTDAQALLEEAFLALKK